MVLPNLNTIVLATRNSGKVKEFQSLLRTLDCRILSLHDVGIDFEVEESGTTFVENARLKAVTYSNRTSFPVLADDSGLEVTALEGRPGVHSARYAGDDATDEARNTKLLAALDGNGENREARFLCALALAKEGAVLLESEGECRGEIIGAPRGQNGFGYDPIFLLPELAKTFAEMSPSEKNRFSHRTRAVRQMLKKLNQ
jgi:XTP/dITP diphosphohydrolase